MDSAFEKRIARAFIYKNKADRFLYELPGVDRRNALCRLPEILRTDLMLMESTHNPKLPELLEIMKRHGAADQCYVMCEDREIDGTYTTLGIAHRIMNHESFPSLIVGLPSGFTHYRFESMSSHQPNGFLKPATRFDGLPWT